MFSPFSSRDTSVYQRISNETIFEVNDQHRLVALLYEGVLTSISKARGAMSRGDIQGKCEAIGKAVRIIEEGLLTGLDREAGGELAENLSHVYEYSLRQLILANSRNDDARLEEVALLIQPIAESWAQIKDLAAQNNAAVTNAISQGDNNA